MPTDLAAVHNLMAQIASKKHAKIKAKGLKSQPPSLNPIGIKKMFIVV
jgi:hypothetical protein